MSALRIAVTGGSGKLGRTVVRVRREESNEVVNLIARASADPLGKRSSSGER